MLSRPLARLQPQRMAASSRLAALSAHFSSSAPASSAPGKMSPSASAEPPVVFEAVHSLRKITLNRPTKLNVLNAEIVAPVKKQIEVGADRREGRPSQPFGDRLERVGRGRRRQGADRVLLWACFRNGRRVSWRLLCCSRATAGRSARVGTSSVSQLLPRGRVGLDRRMLKADYDPAALATALADQSKWADCSAFFHAEYELDGFIAKMKTALVSFLHGASSKQTRWAPILHKIALY